jgi:hypothetical protein
MGALMGNHFVGDLIPAGMTSSGKYTHTRRASGGSGSGWDDPARAVYLRSDLEAIQSQSETMSLAGISGAEYENWEAEKLAETQSLMAHCTRIEEFQTKYRAEQPRHRFTRQEFFVAQAAKLSPPMSIDVMEKIMAYKMSLDSNHEPTLRSWTDLKKKLLPHRAAAEELRDLELQNKQYYILAVKPPAIQVFIQLHNLRSRAINGSRMLLPEQSFVIALAQKELINCKSRAVADADLVLLVLKGVYNTYQQLSVGERPRGTNYDMTVGPYQLTLDDAAMIIHEVIQPEVRGWNDSVRTRETLERFKCVGCVRKDCTTRYTFDRLFQHLHEIHATYVAEGEDFHKLYRPFNSGTNTCLSFPWYTVLWPKNLPIAASHHEVSKEKKWLADVEVPYIPLAPPEAVPAFLNRHPFDNPDIDATDFAGNLCYVAAKLRPTTLHILCQIRIALKYALDRYFDHAPLPRPILDEFIECLPKLRAANEDYNLTFNCGVCKRNPNIPHSVIHTRPDTLIKLQTHFSKIHSAHDWTKSFLDLPSDTQLAKALEDADEELKREKRATKEREASLAKNPRKKADPTAKVILEKPEASKIFDELFPRV